MRSTPLLRPLPMLGLALAALAAVPSSAEAYEDRLTLGVEAGYGLVAIEDSDLPQHGALLGLSSSIGLDDIWSIRGHVAYAYHPAEEPLHVGIFGAEVIYLLDVVQIVPFFGAGIDALGTIFEGTAGIELGAHVVVGVEYLLSRDALIGLDIRPHILPFGVDVQRLDPVYITSNLRFSLMFEL